ncbi:related to multidrug resistant protein [Armillaria ostoyae]|uniref:Related to multidrug resistant protein n=1 Tax=Armillaria ostoyae TaxID=47428 RepID=A0A284R1T8_ARMOS|nr:related to multidrug resistant protein [Armillaria ostoyae]
MSGRSISSLTIANENSPVPYITEKKAEAPDYQFEVVLDETDDPQSMSPFRKWVIIVIISCASLCVTCASSVASFAEQGVAKDFHVSHTVTILSISLFVEGLGLGPLLVGPLSEVYGRSIVYRISYAFFFVFSWPIAFAPNIEVYLIFRFVTGFCGSAFLSVAGGSVSDLFDNATVANPMAFYTISPFIGPVLGPLISGFINQNAHWRWTFRVLLIWIFVQLVALFLFVPETYVPVILKKKAARCLDLLSSVDMPIELDVRLRKSTGNHQLWAPLDRRDTNLTRAIIASCYTPFQLIWYDRMALLLNTWTSLILGILYLSFQAFPIIFEERHGFSMQQTGMTYLGIGLGMICAMLSQPYWNRVVACTAEKNNGKAPPEARLYMGQVGGILVPLGLYWLAFTTYSSVHWIVPIIASVPFGAGIYFVFTAVFTYLVTAYRPIAASAMASNSAMRSTFAAAFPLFAGAMYHKLGTVGATALLAGIMTMCVPLP